MKAIKRSTMPDGTTIQVEDWSEDYPEICKRANTLAAYPVSKQTHDEAFAPQRGRKMRATFEFASEQEATEALEKLAAGQAMLRDYIEKYNGPRKYADCF